MAYQSQELVLHQLILSHYFFLILNFLKNLKTFWRFYTLWLVFLEKFDLLGTLHIPIIFLPPSILTFNKSNYTYYSLIFMRSQSDYGTIEMFFKPTLQRHKIYGNFCSNGKFKFTCISPSNALN